MSALTHGYLLAADPPGTENRRWRCQHCNQLGTLAELTLWQCPEARPATDAELIEAIEPRRGERRERAMKGVEGK